MTSSNHRGGIFQKNNYRKERIVFLNLDSHIYQWISDYKIKASVEGMIFIA